MTLLEYVGAQLHMARRGQRLTLHEVAALAHVNMTDISKIERGLRPLVPVAVVAKLAAVCQVGLHALFPEEHDGNVSGVSGDDTPAAPADQTHA